MRVVNIELDIDADDPARQQSHGGEDQRGAGLARIRCDAAHRGHGGVRRGCGITQPALAVSDSIRQRFSPDTAGSATAFVIHEAADSSYQVWLARTGHLQTDSTRYGGGQSQSGGASR